jgi:predicted metal-binding membrane protein
VSTSVRFADVDVPGLVGPSRRADRKDSLSGLLPWAIGGAWALAVLGWAEGWGHSLGHDHLIEHGPPLWVGLPLFLAGWLAMVVAMMLPSSLPAFRSFSASTLVLGNPRRLGAAFLAGYMAAWTGLGGLAFIGDIGFHRFVHHWPWLAGRPWLIGGTVLVIAGVFELTPPAGRCVRGSSGASDRPNGDLRLVNSRALRLGIEHGLERLSRCWPLMLLSFAAGMPSLEWMVVLTALMVLQERRGGERAALPMGIALLAVAGVVLAHPGWMPSLFPVPA